MSNREFGEIVQGPMTEDGPSVDDLRAQMYGGQVAGRYTYREDRTPQDSAVIRGKSEAGDGTLTDEDMAEIRKTAGIGAANRHEVQAAKAYTDRRNPLTGEVIRTYEDGRTETVDETRPASRVRGHA